MSEAAGPTTSPAPATPRQAVSLVSLFKVFLTIGAISFGGGVVAYLREYIVRGEQWMDDEEFLDSLEIGQTLPGLIAVNLSVIIGDRIRGAAGAIAAAVGILLPGTVVVMTAGILYLGNRQNPAVNHFLGGVAAAAVGLLTAVALQLGHKQLVHLRDFLLVMATFVAISLLHQSLIIVILVVGPVAVLLYHPTTHKSGEPKPPRTREPIRLAGHR
ncbi:MAG TPA: chromate transporter [Candidatus Binataceae bacterium]|nr:chromate transporter [Candidatus Binataceae bacterium]